MPPKVRMSRQAKAYASGVKKSFVSSYKKKNLPSRLRVSKTRYSKTKQLAKILANYGENKYQGYSNVCTDPVPKPGSGQQPISYQFFNSSVALANNPEFNPMGLFKFQQGDGNDQRIGNYMYVRGSTINCEIQMMPTTSASDTSSLLPQTDFRVLCVKANRKFDNLGKSPNPADSLFLTTFNNTFGYSSATPSTYEYMSQPVNKRKWLVYKDYRFTLNTPVLESTGSLNHALSTKVTKKRIRFKLPIYKKCHFNNSQDPEQNIPDNVDTQWLFIIQAAYTNHCFAPSGTANAPRNFKVNWLGTSTARDS